MNWVVFALLAWLALGLETGLRPAFQLGTMPIAPSFVLILVTFVSLWARPRHLLGAALLLGALMDLINQLPTSTGEAAVVMGPWALGCMLAAYTVLNFRAMVDRKHPLALAFLCFLGACVANILVLALLALRAFYDDIIIESASKELLQRVASAAYTGVLAPFVGYVLNLISPWLGFKNPRSVVPNFRQR